MIIHCFIIITFILNNQEIKVYKTDNIANI
jgi:hypothetical protein